MEKLTALFFYQYQDETLFAKVLEFIQTKATIHERIDNYGLILLVNNDFDYESFVEDLFNKIGFKRFTIMPMPPIVYGTRD